MLHVGFYDVCFMETNLFKKLKTFFCLFPYRISFAHESKEKSLIIYCLKQSEDKNDHDKT